jgi:hypothetical protein
VDRYTALLLGIPALAFIFLLSKTGEPKEERGFFGTISYGFEFLEDLLGWPQAPSRAQLGERYGFWLVPVGGAF